MLPRNRDLVRRVLVTLAVLAIYRLGAAVPLPGVDIGTLMSSGAMHRLNASLSIMALGVVPLLTAVILVEAAKIVWPPLRVWNAEPGNTRRLDIGTWVAALLLAGIQAGGISAGLEEIDGAVLQPGLGFRLGIAVTLVAATAVVIWLALMITQHGVGSGLWILAAVPHVLSFGGEIAYQAWVVASGAQSALALVLPVALLALTTATLAVLVRATPPLADTEELVWMPLLGTSVASWLLTTAMLIEWLVVPAGQYTGTLVPQLGLYGMTLLLTVAVAIVVLLRRRSLAEPRTSFRAALALPLVGSVGGLIFAAHLAATLTRNPQIPNAATLLMLAGVGLLLVERYGKTALSVTTPQDSPTRPSAPI